MESCGPEMAQSLNLQRNLVRSWIVFRKLQKIPTNMASISWMYMQVHSCDDNVAVILLLRYLQSNSKFSKVICIGVWMFAFWLHPGGCLYTPPVSYVAGAITLGVTYTTDALTPGVAYTTDALTPGVANTTDTDALNPAVPYTTEALTPGVPLHC